MKSRNLQGISWKTSLTQKGKNEEDRKSSIKVLKSKSEMKTKVKIFLLYINLPHL